MEAVEAPPRKKRQSRRVSKSEAYGPYINEGIVKETLEPFNGEVVIATKWQHWGTGQETPNGRDGVDSRRSAPSGWEGDWQLLATHRENGRLDWIEHNRSQAAAVNGSVIGRV